MGSSDTILFGCKLKWENYANYEDRLATFQSWPTQLKQNKYELACCGFFYTKEADIVQCFVCNVKVSQWEAGDIPAIEHQKHSNGCNYMRLTGTGEKKSNIGLIWEHGAFSPLNYDM